MKKMSRDQVIMLHSIVMNQSGGINGVRDNSIINNHPFIDGNKRIGILTMLVFLKINNVILKCQDDDIINLGLGVASGKYGVPHIMEWIILHSKG
jgi:death-on-curing protein